MSLSEKACIITLYLLCSLAVVHPPCQAGSDGVQAMSQRATARSEVSSKERLSLQLVSGALFSPFCLTSSHPVFDYVQTNLRIGRMLNGPTGSDSVLRGHFEGILELSNSVIYKGPGNYIGGFTALIRYNCLLPDANLVPYIQTGAGIVYADAYKDHSQRVIGQAIEFSLQAGLGLHYLVHKNWSIDTEATFQHISSAGLSDRNHGLNAVGGFVGLTCFCNHLWK
ncbi:MAG: acyloxyacyl hydrolase [Thermodesulfobacteriota bacterium]|nr:acyloxyacyl hydrolase [Thermodesulfobacteriota bacterium]